MRDMWGLKQTERKADFHPLQPLAGQAESSNVLRASRFQSADDESQTPEVNCTAHVLTDVQIRRPWYHHTHAEYNF